MRRSDGRALRLAFEISYSADAQALAAAPQADIAAFSSVAKPVFAEQAKRE